MGSKSQSENSKELHFDVGGNDIKNWNVVLEMTPDSAMN